MNAGKDRVLYRFTRWMYPGGRANRLARLLNSFGAVHYGFGILAPRRGVTLEVRGRRTGQPVRCPLVMVDCDGERYLVSMFGADANWVRNVRAAGGRAVLRHGHREAVQLTEVGIEARAPILRRYLDYAPGGRPHIPVDRHAPVADFEKIANQFPVFRIQPIEERAHEGEAYVIDSSAE